MICKLCLKDKPLLKRSHIIPNFMYKDLFDENHFLYEVKIDKDKSKKLSTGGFESNILCDDCDNALLGSLEHYAHYILYGIKLPKSNEVFIENRVNQHGVVMTYAKGIDYAKFKLFLLSILWRSSISNLDFFKNVDLGPYEEEIRSMILNNNPKSPMDFPCFISSYRNYKTLPYELIGQPRRYRHSNILGYSFLIGGLLYIFLISRRDKPDYISEVAINENNEISIVHMGENNAKKILNYYMQKEFF